MSNRDPFAQMWAQALSMLDRAEQMQREFFKLRPAASHPAWEPPVDIVETPAEILIVVALPGVAAESISVNLSGRELCVAALRAWPGIQPEAIVRRLEIPHGRFERRIALPAAAEVAQSRFTGGCLYLTLHKQGA